MDSHTDGATALLHLSLTLGGRRVLRISRFRERHSPYKPQGSRRRGVPPGDEVSVWNDEAYYPQELCDFPQVKGSVYISSPFCFEHGVKYESSSADPVFALQRLVFLSLLQLISQSSLILGFSMPGFGQVVGYDKVKVPPLQSWCCSWT